MAKTKKSGEAKQAELPKALKRSSDKAQRTFTKTFDAAFEQYGDEERAYRTAYSSLEKKYEKVDGKWKRIKDEDEKKSDKKKSDKKAEKKSDKKSDKKAKDPQKSDKKASKKSDKKDSKKKSDKKVSASKGDKKKGSKKKETKKSSKKAEQSIEPELLTAQDVVPADIDIESTPVDIEDFMTEEIPAENLYGAAPEEGSAEEILETLEYETELQESLIPDELEGEGIEILDPAALVEEDSVDVQVQRLEGQLSGEEGIEVDTPAPASSSSRSVEDVTKRELYAEAVSLNIKGRSTFNKEELFAAVEAARASASS